MKYKVGDIVKIKENLIAENYYGFCQFVEPMRKYLGKESMIRTVLPNSYYLVGFDGWCFTDEMLEPVEERDKIGRDIRITSDG